MSHQDNLSIVGLKKWFLITMKLLLVAILIAILIVVIRICLRVSQPQCRSPICAARD